MKRKREDDKLDVDPPLIKVEYTNLPTESRHKLDLLLHEWKNWHADRYPEGFRPPEVLSGALRYEPSGALSSLPESSLPVLDDRPAPSINPITRTMWFNVQYERTGEVPKYERAVNRPLKIQQRQQPVGAISSSLPNGDNKTSEGVILAESVITHSVVAFPGIAGSDRAFIPAAGGSGGQGLKRQRSSQRCFNCGSYAHSLRECWKEHDPEAIQDARKRLQGVAGAGGNGGPPKRYFLLEDKTKHRKKKNRREEGTNNDEAMRTSGSEEEDGELEEESSDEEELTPFERLHREFPLAAPGSLSTSLREALGIGALDAPPWLHAMRAMGVPPAYRPRIEAKTVDIEEKKQEEQEEEMPPPPPPPPLELEEKGGGEVLLPVIEDKIGVSNAIAINLAAVQGRDNEAEDFIQLGTEEDSENDKEEEEEADRIGTIYRKEVIFPGINAPIPEGADPVQWGGSASGGGGGYHHQVPSLQQQQPQPPPPLLQHQIPEPMYSAVPSHEYYAQHSYHQQEWHQHQRREYYPPSAPAAAPAAAAGGGGAAYHHQTDYYGHHHYHHHQHHQQQHQAPVPAGGYYNPPPPDFSSVLPYQPPPPPTQQPPQFSSPAGAAPPPPPPSKAGNWS